MKFKYDRALVESCIKKKILLSDGSIHSIITRLLKSGYWVYFCLPCRVTSVNYKALVKHILGKRHHTKMLSRKVWPVDMIMDHPYKNLMNNAFVNGLSIIDTNEPSVVAPNQPSTITPNKLAHSVLNKSPIIICDESEPPKVETPSQLEECIPVKGKSIVGLEYFLEILDDKKDPTYFCALCKVSSNSQTVLEHIQGFSHKLEYLSSHYPRPFRALHNIAGKHLQAGKVQVVENICSCIEKAYGRLKPLIVSSEKFHENRDKYLKEVNDSKHFTEADGGSFEELVDEEYIIAISKINDDDNMKSTISFNDDKSTFTYGQDPKKNEKNPNQERNQSLERNWDKRNQEKNQRSRERNRSFESPERNWDKRNQKNRRSRERNRSDESPERKRNKRSQDRGRRIHESSQNVRTPESNRNKRSQERELLNKSIERSRSNRSLERGRNTRSPKSNRNIKSREKSFDRGTSWNQREDQKIEFETNKFHDVDERNFQIKRSRSPLRSFSHKEQFENPYLKCSISKHMKKRLTLFNTKYTCYLYRIKKKYNEYKENPQSHPDYKDEYLKFMDGQKHTFCNADEMKIEWFKYWSKRVRVLQDIELDRKKRALMSNFGVTDKQIKGFDREQRNKWTDYKIIKPLDLDKLTVISVLHQYTALKKYLGSLEPKVADLLNIVLKMENEKQNSSNEILNVDEYCVLLETVKEKIKGQLLANLIDPDVKEEAKLTITYADGLLQNDKFTKTYPDMVVNTGTVKKAAIANEIVTFLGTLGTHVTNEELKTLLNAVVDEGNTSPNTSAKPLSGTKLLIQLAEIRQKNSQAKKATSTANTSDIIDSPQDRRLLQSDSKIGSLWERNAPFVDKSQDKKQYLDVSQIKSSKIINKDDDEGYNCEFITSTTQNVKLKQFPKEIDAMKDGWNSEKNYTNINYNTRDGIKSNDQFYNSNSDNVNAHSIANVLNMIRSAGFNELNPQNPNSTITSSTQNSTIPNRQVMKGNTNPILMRNDISQISHAKFNSMPNEYQNIQNCTNINDPQSHSQVSSSMSVLPNINLNIIQNCIDMNPCNINDDSMMNSVNIPSFSTSGNQLLGNQLLSNKMQGDQFQGDLLQGMRMQRNLLQSQLNLNKYQQRANKFNMQKNQMQANQMFGNQMQRNQIPRSQMQDNNTQDLQMHNSQMFSMGMQNNEIQNMCMQGNQMQYTSMEGNHMKSKNMFGENSNQMRQIQNNRTINSINQMQSEQLQGSQMQCNQMQGGSKIGSQMQFGNMQGGQIGQMNNSPMPYRSSLIDQLHNTSNHPNSQFKSSSKFYSNSPNSKLNTFSNQNTTLSNISTFHNKSKFNSTNATMSNFNTSFGINHSMSISCLDPINRSDFIPNAQRPRINTDDLNNFKIEPNRRNGEFNNRDQRNNMPYCNQGGRGYRFMQN